MAPRSLEEGVEEGVTIRGEGGSESDKASFLGFRPKNPKRFFFELPIDVVALSLLPSSDTPRSDEVEERLFKPLSDKDRFGRSCRSTESALEDRLILCDMLGRGTAGSGSGVTAVRTP